MDRLALITAPAVRRANGGDVLVLTADDAPWDIYNAFLLNISDAVAPNSVTTARFTARSGVESPRLSKLLRAASAIFVTGGDQSKCASTCCELTLVFILWA